MKLFDVYPLFDINIVKGKGCHVWDDQGNEYLDLYGGHAVISIGHAHPHYVDMLSCQAATLGFYSNSVVNKLQQTLAERLGRACGYDDYQLFLINSGAEANENALKLASFHNGRTRIVSFAKAFHGRTSLAVEVTDNPKIIAPVNACGHVTYLPLNDIEAMQTELRKGDVCAVIIEGIQGVGGIRVPEAAFLQALRRECDATGTVLILDEIQSGYGRSGKFFAHQYAGIRPDLITVAKGIGNGFPMGAVLISPQFKPVYGQLGTTFGGNHLACAAALAVLDVIEAAANKGGQRPGPDDRHGVRPAHQGTAQPAAARAESVHGRQRDERHPPAPAAVPDDAGGRHVPGKIREGAVTDYEYYGFSKENIGGFSIKLGLEF